MNNTTSTLRNKIVEEIKELQAALRVIDKLEGRKASTVDYTNGLKNNMPQDKSPIEEKAELFISIFDGKWLAPIEIRKRYAEKTGKKEVDIRGYVDRKLYKWKTIGKLEWRDTEGRGGEYRPSTR